MHRLTAAAAPGDRPVAKPPILACPPGTVLQGGAPPEQFEAWCEGRPDASGTLRRHGPSRTWNDDGATWIELAWHEGKRDGPFVEYRSNGRKAREGTYRLDAATPWQAVEESPRRPRPTLLDI